MRQWMDRYRWESIAAGMLLISAYLIVNIHVPWAGEMISHYSRLGEYEEKRELAGDRDEILKEYAAREESLRQRIFEEVQDLTGTERMSDVVETVYDQSGKSGVMIRWMRPLEEIKSGRYTMIPVLVNAEGTYHELAEFAFRLERARYIIQLTELEMVVPERGIRSNVRLSATIKIRIISMDPEMLEEGGDV